MDDWVEIHIYDAGVTGRTDALGIILYLCIHSVPDLSSSDYTYFSYIPRHCVLRC